MSLTIKCPSCQNSYHVAEQRIGHRVRCHACRQEFTLSSADDETGNNSLSGPHSPQPTESGTFGPTFGSGKQAGRFEILEEVGAGACGTVYKAYDSQLDRVVAMKVPKLGVLGSQDDIQRFKREAKAAAGLHHPNIVPVHEAGEFKGVCFIVSQFIDGDTLGACLKSEKRMSHREVAALVRKLAEALHYAHGQGIVHRDVKPDNIMIDSAGEPAIMDFGLARRDEGDALRTQEGVRMGTPAYMGPEQHTGKSHQADGRSDQWSLGVMLYEMLTGVRPFRGGNELQLAYAVQETEPDTPRKLDPSISKDMETITLKCLVKEPARRYQTCQDLADDLRRLLDDEPIRARRIGRLERSARWCRRNPVMAGLVGLSTALLVLVALVSALGYASTNVALSDAETQRKKAKQQELLAEQKNYGSPTVLGFSRR